MSYVSRHPLMQARLLILSQCQQDGRCRKRTGNITFRPLQLLFLLFFLTLHPLSLIARTKDGARSRTPLSDEALLALIALTCSVQAVSDRPITPVSIVLVLHNNVSLSPADFAEPMVLVL